MTELERLLKAQGEAEWRYLNTSGDKDDAFRAWKEAYDAYWEAFKEAQKN